MATMQKSQVDEFVREFDPLAIPSLPVELSLWSSSPAQTQSQYLQPQAHSQSQTLDAELAQLGQEPLFSGTRTVLVSEELYGSLVGAKHSFILALDTILQRRQTPNQLVPPDASPIPFVSTSDSNKRLADLLQTLRNNDFNTQSSPIDELEQCLETVLDHLSPLDADLAFSLSSLLRAIERLLQLSRLSVGGSPRLRDGFQTPSDVYTTLEQEAVALKMAREPEGVVSALREVERAERDLLWGRVCDLSEKVQILSRQRANEYKPQMRDDLSISKASWKEQEAIEEKEYDLPGYEDHFFPPAYQNHPEFENQNDFLKYANPEKMQRELDKVSEAIERLYVVSPQLANQRAEPDRHVLREQQLANLGNAIERLAEGRLNNQRAVATACVPEDSEQRALRLKRIEDMQLDMLIEKIDRAASRTLKEQRVDLAGKRKQRYMDSSDTTELERVQYIVANSGKGRLASQDAEFFMFDQDIPFEEAARRQYILNNVGRGRMESQDFDSCANSPVLSCPPSPKSTPVSPISMNFSQFMDRRSHSVDSPQLSSSVGSNGQTRFPSKISNSESDTWSVTSTADKDKPSVRKALRLSMLRRGLSSSSKQSSVSESRADDKQPRGPESSSLNYIAEESINLGSTLLWFWPRILVKSEEVFNVTAIDKETLTLNSSLGGPLAYISLPSPVTPIPVTVVNHGRFYEAKLQTTRPFGGRSRNDLEIRSPLLAEELQSGVPKSFLCLGCETQVLDSSTVTRYNALPSEHWAELMESWMCHQDQQLSEDILAKGRAIKPRPDEGLVGSKYVMFPYGLGKNCEDADDIEAYKTDTSDLLQPIRCVSCLSFVGYRQSPPGEDPKPDCVRLLKYAVKPINSIVDIPLTNLSCHISAEMLELGQAHASHHFVLNGLDEKLPQVFIWMFNPSMRVSFSGWVSSLLDQENAGVNLSTVQKTISAIKAFYYVAETPEDDKAMDLLKNAFSKAEHLEFPTAVISQVAELLRASNKLYPVGQRVFNDLEVGFLERL